MILPAGLEVQGSLLPTSEASPPRQQLTMEFAGIAVMTGFLALVFLIPTRLTFPPLGNAGRPTVIAGVLLLLLWGLTFTVRHGAPPQRQPVRWLILGYLVIETIGYTTGYARGLVSLEANSADRWLIVNMSMAGIVLFFSDAPRNRRQLDLVVRVLLGFGVFIALVGVLQYTTGFDLQQHIRIPGLQPLISLVEIRERGTGGVSRVAGLSTHYIEYGVVLALLTPIAVHFALFARTPVQRAIRWGVTAAITAAVPLSVSRSGIVALGVAMLTLGGVWSWRLRYNALVCGLVAVVLFRAVTPGVLGTLQALFVHFGDDPSVEGRTNDYDIVVPMIYEHLLFGRGAGTFLPERYIVLDNQILYTLVSSGILGLAGLLGLFFGGMGLARSIRRRAHAVEDRHLGQALCASLAAALVTSITFDSFSFVQFRGVVCVLLGLVGALWRLSGTSVLHASVMDRDPRGRVMPPLLADLRRRPRRGHREPLGRHATQRRVWP